MRPFSSCGTGFNFQLNETDFMKWVSKCTQHEQLHKMNYINLEDLWITKEGVTMAHHEQRFRGRRGLVFAGTALLALVAVGGVAINHYMNPSPRYLYFRKIRCISSWSSRMIILKAGVRRWLGGRMISVAGRIRRRWMRLWI